MNLTSTTKNYVEWHLNLSPESPILLNFSARVNSQIHATLNKVWGLEGCPLKGQPVHMNRSLRFCFGGLIVQLAWIATIQASFFIQT